MSRWRSHFIPRVVVLSCCQSECPCLRCTQVTKILSSLIKGFIQCCGGWRSTTTQVLNASVITSCSQPCILTRRPRPGLTTTSKVSTVGDGCGPSKMSSQVCIIDSYMTRPFRMLHRSSILWSTPWMVVCSDSIMSSNTMHWGWYMNPIPIGLTPNWWWGYQLAWLVGCRERRDCWDVFAEWNPAHGQACLRGHQGPPMICWLSLSWSD